MCSCQFHDHVVSDDFPQCGGTLNDSEGTFSVPFYKYEDRYDENIKCRWTIIATMNNFIEIRFTNFELEDDYLCTYDYVKVILNISHNILSVSAHVIARLNTFSSPEPKAQSELVV